LVFCIVEIGGVLTRAGGFIVLILLFVVLLIFILAYFLKQNTPVTDFCINFSAETLLSRGIALLMWN
jgi:hypothetical protein